MTGSFSVIAGSGHCGTMWLSRVLNARPAATWTHELRTQMSALPWQQADALPVTDDAFVTYWARVYKEQRRGAFGDSNSWPPESLPAVNDLIPVSKVIYLTRDKDRQLYSLYSKSPVWSREPYPAAAERRLDLYAQLSGQPRDIRLLVDANDWMPDWLRTHGMNVVVYSLEQLTTDVEALRKLAPELTTTELRQWQRANVNQKVFA